MFKNLAKLSLICSFFVINSFAQTEIKVPRGKSVLPNGYFEIGEWKKANKSQITPEIEMLAKQDKTYVYLGFRFLKDKHTGIDFYLAGNKLERRMLHISSSLGEKSYQSDKWQDWIWGQNNLWAGNVINLVTENGKRRIVKPDGFEFQISKKMFKSKKWSLRLNLKRPQMVIPKNSTDTDTSNWIKIKI